MYFKDYLNIMPQWKTETIIKPAEITAEDMLKIVKLMEEIRFSAEEANLILSTLFENGYKIYKE